MGRLLGYLATRTDRLGDVLDEERDAIALSPDFSPDAWGLGFYQRGDVLHKQRPKLDEGATDWADPVVCAPTAWCCIFARRQPGTSAPTTPSK